MTIRLKVLSLAFVLLAIWATVIGGESIVQLRIHNDLQAIEHYLTPVQTLASDFDTVTDEYELLPLRLLRLPNVSQDEIASNRSQMSADATKMAEDLRQLKALIDQAKVDDGIPRPVQVTLVGMSGTIDLFGHKLSRFIETGNRVVQAITAGRFDEARSDSLEFITTEDAFGPDAAEVRHEAGDANLAIFSATNRRLARITYLKLGLFALAGCLGIGAGALLSAHIVRALRVLVDRARAVEAGEFETPIVVTTKDEVGQVAVAFNRMADEIHKREKIRDTFGKFVDPRIVDTMISETGEGVEHAERQTVTVFFSDIRGFTSISELLTPTAIVKLLNQYFSVVTAPIAATNGIVDKYMGDGVMAFWAAPFCPGDTHAGAACLSALMQQEAMQGLNKDLPNITGLRRGAPTLHVRMGLATGEAIVGTIGSATSKTFTVIGDTVNLASRLEGANKVYGTQIIITEETLRFAQDKVECRELDLMTVVGKSEPVRIYELLGPAGQLAPGGAELREEFGKGLAAYRAREWDTAENRFRRCLELRADDGPSTLYLERIAIFRNDPPPANWDGVWHLTKK